MWRRPQSLRNLCCPVHTGHGTAKKQYNKTN